ncbi:hypothetical protein D910_04946 [Dendroctonus ponderosae]|uniref:Uncharacterized protein n=1 Tax=Dendroctonus ponderosae TaxID=77166 RepID=U4UC79_DENPD|nr:hypothetical protein D910_04946 [Dendroctonus ponderosae]
MVRSQLELDQYQDLIESEVKCGLIISSTSQLYNPSSSSAVATTSSLDSLTGLPMQALAQQVSRLNPSAGQGLHQQNVLINIQQFPTQPQQQYQAPHGQMPQHQPMYPAHYPAQPAIHQPYGYQITRPCPFRLLFIDNERQQERQMVTPNSPLLCVSIG